MLYIVYHIPIVIDYRLFALNNQSENILEFLIAVEVMDKYTKLTDKKRYLLESLKFTYSLHNHTIMDYSVPMLK